MAVLSLTDELPAFTCDAVSTMMGIGIAEGLVVNITHKEMLTSGIDGEQCPNNDNKKKGELTNPEAVPMEYLPEFEPRVALLLRPPIGPTHVACFRRPMGLKSEGATAKGVSLSSTEWAHQNLLGFRQPQDSGCEVFLYNSATKAGQIHTTTRHELSRFEDCLKEVLPSTLIDLEYLPEFEAKVKLLLRPPTGPTHVACFRRPMGLKSEGATAKGVSLSSTEWAHQNLLGFRQPQDSGCGVFPYSSATKVGRIRTSTKHELSRVEDCLKATLSSTLKGLAGSPALCLQRRRKTEALKPRPPSMPKPVTQACHGGKQIRGRACCVSMRAKTKCASTLGSSDR